MKILMKYCSDQFYSDRCLQRPRRTYALVSACFELFALPDRPNLELDIQRFSQTREKKYCTRLQSLGPAPLVDAMTDVDCYLAPLSFTETTENNGGDAANRSQFIDILEVRKELCVPRSEHASPLHAMFRQAHVISSDDYSQQNMYMSFAGSPPIARYSELSSRSPGKFLLLRCRSTTVCTSNLSRRMHKSLVTCRIQEINIYLAHGVSLTVYVLADSFYFDIFLCLRDWCLLCCR